MAQSLNVTRSTRAHNNIPRVRDAALFSAAPRFNALMRAFSTPTCLLFSLPLLAKARRHLLFLLRSIRRQRSYANIVIMHAIFVGERIFFRNSHGFFLRALSIGHSRSFCLLGF